MSIGITIAALLLAGLGLSAWTVRREAVLLEREYRDILAILSDGQERYALQLARDIEQQMGREPNVFRLYRALHGLEDSGFLATRQGAPIPERGNRPRIYYRLTEDGLRIEQGRKAWATAQALLGRQA